MHCLSVAVALLGLLNSALAVANGTDEVRHSSPWQAKLYLNYGLDFWPCGGTLLSQNYIVTAARCLNYLGKEEAKGISVYLGAYDVATEDREYFIDGIRASSVIVHEGYNASTYENDIALIKLPEPINYTIRVQPAKLAPTKSYKVGDKGHVSGWQYPIREWDMTHQRLRGGDVYIVETSVCQEEYQEHVIDDSTICASGTVAFCYGDEGTALVVSDGDDQVIIGLAYGAKDVLVPSELCPIVPQTYNPIGKYIDWIKENTDYE